MCDVPHPMPQRSGKTMKLPKDKTISLRLIHADGTSVLCVRCSGFAADWAFADVGMLDYGLHDRCLTALKNLGVVKR